MLTQPNRPMDKVPYQMEHTKNNLGMECCFIRMMVEPYEYLFVTRHEGDMMGYASRSGHQDAMVLRNEKAARKFIYDNNLIGYTPVLCHKVMEDDGSLN